MSIINECPRCVDLWQPRNILVCDTSIKVNMNIRENSLIKIPHPACFYKKHETTEAPIEFLTVAGKDKPIKRIIESKLFERSPYIIDAIMDPPPNMLGTKPVIGSGIDYCRELAIKKACIEAIERVSLFLQPKSQIIWANKNDIDCVEEPNIRFSKKDRVWWCAVYNIKNKQKKFMPLDYIQIPSANNGHSRAYRSSSLGNALHIDYDKAIKHGIEEVLEHFYIYQAWKDFNFSQLSELSYTPEIKKMSSVFHSIGYRVKFLIHVSSNYFVSCLAFVYNLEVDYPKFSFGSGGSWDYIKAINSAAYEVYGQIISQIKNKDFLKEERYKNINWYSNKKNGAVFLKTINSKNMKLITLDLRHQNNDGIKSMYKQAYYVDRGNMLTDTFKLFSIQIIFPNLNLTKENTQYPIPI